MENVRSPPTSLMINSDALPPPAASMMPGDQPARVPRIIVYNAYASYHTDASVPRVANRFDAIAMAIGISRGG